MPLDVLRLMPGILRLQPSPNGPLPVPVLYTSVSSGCKPARPGGTAIGTEKFPVPVCRSGENFSPIPLSAPPPLGNEITELEFVGLSSNSNLSLLDFAIGTSSFSPTRPISRCSKPVLHRLSLSSMFSWSSTLRCSETRGTKTRLETSVAGIGARRLPPTQLIRARSGFRTKTVRKATRLNSGN